MGPPKRWVSALQYMRTTRERNIIKRPANGIDKSLNRAFCNSRIFFRQQTKVTTAENADKPHDSQGARLWRINDFDNPCQITERMHRHAKGANQRKCLCFLPVRRNTGKISRVEASSSCSSLSPPSGPNLWQSSTQDKKYQALLCKLSLGRA